MKKLIEDINLAFPLSIDKTPEGKIVPCAEVGEEGYGANINYTLQITYQNNRAIFSICTTCKVPLPRRSTVLKDLFPRRFMKFPSSHVVRYIKNQ